MGSAIEELIKRKNEIDHFSSEEIRLIRKIEEQMEVYLRDLEATLRRHKKYFDEPPQARAGENTVMRVLVDFLNRELLSLLHLSRLSRSKSPNIQELYQILNRYKVEGIGVVWSQAKSSAGRYSAAEAGLGRAKDEFYDLRRLVKRITQHPRSAAA